MRFKFSTDATPNCSCAEYAARSKSPSLRSITVGGGFWRGDCRSFENFMIECNGLLLLSEIRLDRDLKVSFHDLRPRDCFTPQRIEQQAGGRFDANDGKATSSRNVFERVKVNHCRDSGTPAGSNTYSTCANLRDRSGRPTQGYQVQDRSRRFRRAGIRHRTRAARNLW